MQLSVLIFSTFWHICLSQSGRKEKLKRKTSLLIVNVNLNCTKEKICFVQFQRVCKSQVFRAYIYFLIKLVMLLLLSRFSRVQLCVTLQTAAHQAPPSLGFSRQEHWSGLPFPSPCMKVKSESESRSVVSDPQRPHGLQPTRLLLPWDSPSKNTGVGCRFLLHQLCLFLNIM